MAISTLTRLLDFASEELEMLKRERDAPYLLIVVLVVFEAVAGLIFLQFNLTALWFIMTAGIIAVYVMLWMHKRRVRRA